MPDGRLRLTLTRGEDAGVMPVCRIEQKAFGDERPGPITLQMADAFREQP